MKFSNLIKVSPVKIKNPYLFFLDDIFINENQIIKVSEKEYKKSDFSFSSRFTKEVNLTPQLINRILEQSFTPSKSSKSYFKIMEITMINNEVITILK